jgi:hypothetical protein
MFGLKYEKNFLLQKTGKTIKLLKNRELRNDDIIRPFVDSGLRIAHNNINQDFKRQAKYKSIISRIRFIQLINFYRI